MMKTFISPKIKTVCSALAFIFMGATFQNNAMAQNAGCGFGIDNTKWFTGRPYTVRWSLDGKKVLVSTGGSGGTTGYINSNTDHFIGLVTDTSNFITRDTISDNLNAAGNYGSDLLTRNGGAIFGATSTYVKPSGASVSIPGAFGVLSVANSYNKDTVIIHHFGPGTSNPGNFLSFVNVHDPENPVFGTIPFTATGKVNGGSTIATMDNRIFYDALPQSANIDDENLPHRIKCITFGGTTCPNWQDIVISTGSTSDIQIRPTDGLIFAILTGRSTASNTIQEPESGGVIVFNQNGVLQSGFNFGDLNLLSQGPKVNGANIIRFDGAGNIFANVAATDYSSTFEPAAQIGIVKFDPHGNLDYGFYSNMLKNYNRVQWSFSTYFDVNPVTGMIISSLAFHQNGGKYHAKTGGEYVPTNNVPWYNAFPDNGTGGGSAVPFLGADPSYNSGYNTVHFYYNNGKLKVDGESSGNAAANCGIQPPTVINPVNTPQAHGTIQCNGLAFIQSPVQGVASTLVLKVPVNVDTIGTFTPITVSGSGLTLQDPASSFNATHTGLNEFYVTLVYNGTTPLSQFNINVGHAGSCSADLSDHTKSNPSIIEIWTPENCTYKVIGPDLK